MPSLRLVHERILQVLVGDEIRRRKVDDLAGRQDRQQEEIGHRLIVVGGRTGQMNEPLHTGRRRGAGNGIVLRIDQELA